MIWRTLLAYANPYRRRTRGSATVSSLEECIRWCAP